MTRLMFMATNRITDILLTLQFDYNISPAFDKTYIFYGPDDIDVEILYNKFDEYNIDYSNFVLLNDSVLLNWAYKTYNISYNSDFNIYKFKGWIAQQFFKLIALDYINDDVMLIQDCDTFAIKPYDYYKNNSVVILHAPEISTNGYAKYTSRFIDVIPSNPGEFISEFMPILSNDWQSLKQYIEIKFADNWLISMYNVFDHDCNPLITFTNFSEYELLANWMLQHSNVILQQQHRFYIGEKFKSLGFRLENLDNIKNYNFICNHDAIPDDQIMSYSNDIKRRMIH